MPRRVGGGRFVYEVVEGWGRMSRDWHAGDLVGVAVDRAGRVFVLGRGTRPVVVLTAAGEILDTWGHGLFVRPHGISLDRQGNVYCVDDRAHAIYKFTPGGQLLGTLGTPGVPSDTGYTTDYRSIKRGGPPFNEPTRLAFGVQGDLFVSDGYGNARVHRFDPEGKLIASWGEPGTGPGEFNVPHSLWVHSDGRVYVCDRENSRIQVFTSGGALLTTWSDVSRPSDIHIGSDGHVYVAELGTRAGLFPHQRPPAPDGLAARVSIFDLDGRLLARWGGFEACEPGSFYAPHGLCVDTRGDIYVTEVIESGGAGDGLVTPRCHPIQKFRRIEGSEAAA